MAEAKDFGGGQARRTARTADAVPQRPVRERGGWLSRSRPACASLVAKREPPDNLWVKCPDTGEMIYRPDLEAALWVTPGRAAHADRAGPALRLHLRRRRARRDRHARSAPTIRCTSPTASPIASGLAAARKATGEHDAMVGRPSARSAASRRSFWCRTSPSWAARSAWRAGEAFVAAAQEALKRDVPAGRLHRLGRRADAGGHAGADADGAHHPRAAGPEGRAPALRRGADRSDHRRRHRPPTACWATCTWPSRAR